MAKVKVRPFDAAEFLRDETEIAAFLDEAMESGDTRVIAAALGAVARRRGMSKLAEETGLSRESLYRALSADGNPEFATVLKVAKALNVPLRFVPASVD